MYDEQNFADFEAEEERSSRRERRIHRLEGRVKQLEAQVEVMLTAYSEQAVARVSRQQLGFEWVVVQTVDGGK